MMLDGCSTRQIRSYLSQWARWWTLAADNFSMALMLTRFINACWESNAAIAVIAEGLRPQVLKKIVAPASPEATL